MYEWMFCSFRLLFEDGDHTLYNVTLFKRVIDEFKYKCRENKYVEFLISKKFTQTEHVWVGSCVSYLLVNDFKFLNTAFLLWLWNMIYNCRRYNCIFMLSWLNYFRFTEVVSVSTASIQYIAFNYSLIFISDLDLLLEISFTMKKSYKLAKMRFLNFQLTRKSSLWVE